MAQPQRVHGEVRVRDMRAAKNLSKEETAKIAGRIWTEVQRAGVPIDDAKACRELYEQLWAAHRDFATSFPIPLKWMVYERKYDERAFVRFLGDYAENAFNRTRKEFLDVQAGYLVLLRKSQGPVSVRALNKYREAVKKSLQEDDELFAAASEEAERVADETAAEADRLRRERILAFSLRSRGVQQKGR